MRKPLVLGNWKMNGCLSEIDKLLSTILQADTSMLTSAGVLPPSVYIPFVAEKIKNTPLSLGAQNVYPKACGAYTGEVSAPMLCDFGCRYVLIGHSERRKIFNEDEKFIAQKFHHVKEHGMIPVLCVGETWEERQAHQTFSVLQSQLEVVSSNDPHAYDASVIAYEPVWAIGTGKTAGPNEVQEVHQFIREWISAQHAAIAPTLPILYGGSVNASNAASLFEMPDVDGGLIGGASLDGQQFLEIIKCISSYC